MKRMLDVTSTLPGDTHLYAIELRAGGYNFMTFLRDRHIEVMIEQLFGSKPYVRPARVSTAAERDMI